MVALRERERERERERDEGILAELVVFLSSLLFGLQLIYWGLNFFTSSWKNSMADRFRTAFSSLL